MLPKSVTVLQHSCVYKGFNLLTLQVAVQNKNNEVKSNLTLSYLCPLKGHTYSNKLQLKAAGLFKYV